MLTRHDTGYAKVTKLASRLRGGRGGCAPGWTSGCDARSRRVVEWAPPWARRRAQLGRSNFDRECWQMRRTLGRTSAVGARRELTPRTRRSARQSRTSSKKSAARRWRAGRGATGAPASSRASEVRTAQVGRSPKRTCHRGYQVLFDDIRSFPVQRTQKPVTRASSILSPQSLRFEDHALVSVEQLDRTFEFG